MVVICLIFWISSCDGVWIVLKVSFPYAIITTITELIIHNYEITYVLYLLLPFLCFVFTSSSSDIDVDGDDDDDDDDSSSEEESVLC